jgi:hypothetical protein
MMNHKFAEFPQELCSDSSSLSANKVSSQLIFRLDQAIASRLLSVVAFVWLEEFVVYEAQ